MKSEEIKEVVARELTMPTWGMTKQFLAVHRIAKMRARQ